MDGNMVSFRTMGSSCMLLMRTSPGRMYTTTRLQDKYMLKMNFENFYNIKFQISPKNDIAAALRCSQPVVLALHSSTRLYVVQVFVRQQIY